MNNTTTDARVLVVDAPFDADGCETPFGQRWGGGRLTLNAEQLTALLEGKTLAVDVQNEYVTFIKLDAVIREKLGGMGYGV